MKSMVASYERVEGDRNQDFVITDRGKLSKAAIYAITSWPFYLQSTVSSADSLKNMLLSIKFKRRKRCHAQTIETTTSYTPFYQ